MEPNDWRLDMAQEPEFYKKYVWEFKKWSQTRAHWGHDHCEFCNTEISSINNEEILDEGWTNENEYYWVCKTCFSDFKEIFKWNIKI